MLRSVYPQYLLLQKISLLTVLLFLLADLPAPGQQVAGPPENVSPAVEATTAGPSGVASSDSAACPMCGGMMGGMPGWMMPAMMVGGVLLWLAVVGALVALAVFLIRRSRPPEEGSPR